MKFLFRYFLTGALVFFSIGVVLALIVNRCTHFEGISYIDFDKHISDISKRIERWIFLLLLMNSFLADKVDYDIEEYFSSLYIFSIEYSQDYKSIFLENGIVIDADKETDDPRVKYRAFFVRELISFFTSDSLTSLFVPVFIS